MRPISPSRLIVTCLSLTGLSLLSLTPALASGSKAVIRSKGPARPVCGQYSALAGARILSSPDLHATVLLRLRSGARIQITGQQPKAPFLRVHVPGAGVFGYLHRAAVRCQPAMKHASPFRSPKRP